MNRFARAAAHGAYLALVACAVLVAGMALAHPGSAIEVAQDGRTYLVDTGGGVFVVERDGTLGRRKGPALHWFALDESSRLANTRWPAIAGGEIVSVGREPTLVFSSDFPVAIGSDGALYYPFFEGGSRWRIVRVAPSGARSIRANPQTKLRADGSMSWINGMASAAQGALYFTHDASIHRISAAGVVTTVADNVRVPGCKRIPGVEVQSGPYLRGLDVAPNGTVFVAASGCGALLMVDLEGRVRPVLRSRPPYSPTAVSVSNGEIFVLEYLHTDSDDREEWLPRVRRIGRDGNVATLVSGTR